MKNNKLAIVLILMVVFLAGMVKFTNASDEIGELPTISLNNSTSNDEGSLPVIGNNNVQNYTSDEQNDTNKETNTNKNTNTNSTLPQTGVAGDTALIVFISVCIISAIYAYLKIRRYNGLQ